MRLALTIVNGLVRRALLRTSCLGLTFRKESGARGALYTSKKFRRVTVSVGTYKELEPRYFNYEKSFRVCNAVSHISYLSS